MANNSADIISALLTSSSGDINSVGKNQIKSLLKTTVTDIKNFEKNKKQIKFLKSENSKLNQKIQIMCEENKALKDLAKLPLNDKMARRVAKKELSMERYKTRRRINLVMNRRKIL